MSKKARIDDAGGSARRSLLRVSVPGRQRRLHSRLRMTWLSALALACMTCTIDDSHPGCAASESGCLDGGMGDAPADVRPDSAPDSPTFDAPSDAESSDARSVDAPGAESPGDAEYWPTPDGATEPDAGWLHPSDLPSDCIYDVAARPEALSILRPMIDCGTGCRRTSGAGYSLMGAFRVAGRTVFALGGGYAITPQWFDVERLLVDADSGTTLAAVRFQVNFADHAQPNCGTEQFATSGTDVGFEVNFARYDAAGSHVLEAWIRTYRGTYDDLQSTLRRVSTTTFTDPAPGGGVIGGYTVTAFGLGPDLASFDYVQSIAVSQADGSTRFVSGPLALHASPPFHVGSDVLFSGATTSGNGVLAQSLHGADATLLRVVSGGDVIVFGTDGTSIAWTEGLTYDVGAGTWATMSLWSGTYDGALHATRVRDMTALPRNEYTAVGGGYFVQAEASVALGRNVYAVYRLSDGSRAVFDPIAAGGPYAAERVRLVAADEIVFDTTHTLWRVDPRTLAFI